MRIFGMPIKKFHPIVFIDYIPRTGGWFLVFCMLVAMFYHEDVNNWLWFFAIVHCLLWPQIVV
ncbi:MAG: MASE2 domain-containing protein, partial [Gammaproteobacteria bacterium]